MPILGYWNIRGLAEPIRYLLEYVGQDFEDKLYESGDAPDYSTESWLKDKFTLGVDFPNLPYYIDGDIKITQSNAILRYLARKYKLDGKTETEKQRVDILVEEVMDLKIGASKLCYDAENFTILKQDYMEKIQIKLDQLEKYLGRNKFFAGEDITFVDFAIYELLDLHRALDSACIETRPNLRAFAERMEALPAVQKHKSLNKPFNGKMAAFR